MSTIVQCACTDESGMNFEPIIAYPTPLNAGQRQLLESYACFITYAIITVPSRKRAHYGMSAHTPLWAQFPAKV